MATKVKRSGGKASGEKAAPAAKASTAAKSNGSAKRGELAAKLRKEAGAIAKRLQGGGKMKAEKERYGLSADTAIVKALAAEGFTSKGAALEVETIAKPDTAAGKKAIVKRRGEGEPWYLLEIATGKTESELRAIVEEAGGPVGRVYRNTGKSESSAGR